MSDLVLSVELSGAYVVNVFINPSFLFSMQLVQIKRVYSGKRRGKFNVEVKFHNQNGRQDMKLEDSNYDRELRSVKSWVLLGTD